MMVMRGSVQMSHYSYSLSADHFPDKCSALYMVDIEHFEDIRLFFCFTASRFEAWMILCHHHFNHKLHLYTTVYGKVICYEEMIKLHNSDYIDLMFVAQERIRGLGLSYEETCILGAFTMMFTGWLFLIL